MLMSMHPELMVPQTATVLPKDIKFTRAQTQRLAKRLGRCFLQDDTFLDNLADALDGIDLDDELSETESDEYASTDEEEIAAIKKQQEEANKNTISSPESESSKRKRKDTSNSAQDDDSQASRQSKRSQRRAATNDEDIMDELEVKLDIGGKKKRVVKF